MPVLFRNGRGWRVSHCHPVTFALDASDRTRLRPGTYACGIEGWRRPDSATGRCDDAAIWMARTLFLLRPHRPGLVSGMVLVLPRHARGTPSYQHGRTTTHRRSGRRLLCAYAHGTMTAGLL